MADLTAQYLRALQLQQTMEERSYTHREGTSVGTVFFHEDYPLKWDLNFLRVETDATYEAIKKAADDSLGGAGLRHRKVHIYDQHLGERLLDRFKDDGWRIDHLLVMILTRDPGKAGPLHVEEVSREEMVPEWFANDLEDNPKLNKEEALMVAASSKVTTESIETHFYAARIDGSIAGWCELYLEDGMGQIENVGTHARFRKRGASTSVVTHAVSVAKEAGADLIFLVADDNDWPKEYYGRMGFEPAGTFFEFVIPSNQEWDRS